jgi:hypothetical protein
MPAIQPCQLIQQRLPAAQLAVGAQGRRRHWSLAAVLHRLDHAVEFAPRAAGDQQDRTGTPLHDLPCRLDAVHDRHHQVHENDVGRK